MGIYESVDYCYKVEMEVPSISSVLLEGVL